MRIRRRVHNEAELDITAFMNLMIVLVPVLLLSMVFAHITVLDLKLPSAGAPGEIDPMDDHIELVVREDRFEVFYPRGFILKTLPNTEEGHDWESLVDLLKQLKERLRLDEKDRKDITVLVEPQIEYQTIVTVMDRVRSYKAVLAASLVDAELFPEISMGDAPLLHDPEAAAEGKP